MHSGYFHMGMGLLSGGIPSAMSFPNIELYHMHRNFKLMTLTSDGAAHGATLWTLIAPATLPTYGEREILFTTAKLNHGARSECQGRTVNTTPGVSPRLQARSSHRSWLE